MRGAKTEPADAATFPALTAGTPLSLPPPTRSLSDPLWGHHRQLGRQGPRHAGVGEGRGRERPFRPGLRWENKKKRRSLHWGLGRGSENKEVAVARRRSDPRRAPRWHCEPPQGTAARAERQSLRACRLLESGPALQDPEPHLAAPRHLRSKRGSADSGPGKFENNHLASDSSSASQLKRTQRRPGGQATPPPRRVLSSGPAHCSARIGGGGPLWR